MDDIYCAHTYLAKNFKNSIARVLLETDDDQHAVYISDCHHTLHIYAGLESHERMVHLLTKLAMVLDTITAPSKGGNNTKFTLVSADGARDIVWTLVTNRKIQIYSGSSSTDYATIQISKLLTESDTDYLEKIKRLSLYIKKYVEFLIAYGVAHETKVKG